MSTRAPATARTASGLVLAVLGGSQFLMTLDSSVMNVSMATVAADLGTTITGIQTAITLYTLVMASLMITGGKVGTIPGRRRAFALGLVIYAAGSLTTANLGASLGTALIGSVLIATLGASFAAGIQDNPAVPATVQEQAKVQLAGGVSFISDTQLQGALDSAGVDQATADAIMSVNSASRLEALRTALALTALLVIATLFMTGRLPAEPGGAANHRPVAAHPAGVEPSGVEPPGDGPG
ncbi:MFS transporter [Arthrobacter sp. PsM3]|uniref:MFS transporter n=1 Tax=Arthrobacter sp. PsM3 TaxID=3030531 RepID=UPI00263BA013|nr:MFS transporter [Arthrobacter sp. PsM3]MDN4646408.1 MFS transporter [Arthrobacter sp. PsM3]